MPVGILVSLPLRMQRVRWGLMGGHFVSLKSPSRVWDREKGLARESGIRILFPPTRVIDLTSRQINYFNLSGHPNIWLVAPSLVSLCIIICIATFKTRWCFSTLLKKVMLSLDYRSIYWWLFLQIGESDIPLANNDEISATMATFRPRSMRDH